MERRATADTVRKSEKSYWYVYILRLSSNRLYTGCTSDIDDRLTRHENGDVTYTAAFLPVELLFYCVFTDKYKAFDFEKYLKSGSGRAFIGRHLM
jgi:putative endonuclease